MNETEIIAMFHQMWDHFPGAVRLIDQAHIVIAANSIAIEKGFLIGCCCAKVGEACIHKGCKSGVLRKTKEAQYDRPNERSIRGWVPITGADDWYVHFTITIPEVMK